MSLKVSFGIFVLLLELGVVSAQPSLLPPPESESPEVFDHSQSAWDPQGYDVVVQWSPIEGAELYEFSIERGDPFPYVRTYVAEEPRKFLKLIPGRGYMWRVRGLNSEKQPVSEYSNLNRLRIQGPHKAP